MSANLAYANLAYANLKDAYLERANLGGANLGGADLRDASDLTQEQLNAARGGDYRTQLPEGLTRPAHWTKAPDTPPPAQPDAAGDTPTAPAAPGSDK